MLSLFGDWENEDSPETDDTSAIPRAPVAAPLTPVSRPIQAPPDLTDGRDELNLAEFPLTLLADRAPAGVESLTFSDTVYDSGDGGRPVARTLTVTPAVGLGLPTPADGDVLLALVQLTRWRNGFASRLTEFTRYEIVKLLRWPDSGASYARIEEALNRWMGVTLFFDRAWWDKRQRAWVNEKFHVLDRVSLRASGRGVSTFTWGEVPFNSFRSENVKKLDLQRYFDLERPASRRLFRFLDKRFHQRPELSFDLRTLACEHVGFSRAYHNGEIKRRLLPAVRELESNKYIREEADDERFVSPHLGEWRVHFGRWSDAPAAAGLAAELVARGVSVPVAAAVVAEFPADHIQARIGVLDWLVEQKDARAVRNPPGFLVQSIRARYAAPRAYPGPDRTAPPPAASGAPPEPPVVSPLSVSPVAAYLAALDPVARAALEAAALAAAPDAAAAVARAASATFRAAAVARAVAAHVARLLAGDGL